MLLFLAGPTLVSLYLSFTNFNLLNPPKWIGAMNYVRLFTMDSRYLTSLRVTFTYVAFAVPLNLAFALALAMLLNSKIKGLGLYRAIYYVPSLLGGSVAIAILWRQVFGPSGIVAQVLAVFGIEGASWVSSPNSALWTLIILHVWQFGSPMIIFLAGLKQIPKELYEAAIVDGAGPMAAVPDDHGADADAGDFLQSDPADHQFVPGLHAGLHRQRRHGRATRFDAVLYALPLPSGGSEIFGWAMPRRWAGCF